jgi:hypothetical protein
MRNRSLWTFLKCVPALLAAALTTSCSSPKIENELYNQLYSVLEERQRLWNLAEKEGGTRETDISSAICPLVSFRNLDKMYADVGNNEIVGKTYIANGMGISPNKSFQYYIRRKVDFVTTVFLYVVMNENGYCNAQYRQYTF